jgi:uncharacterized protein YbaP (TraB family)
MYRFFKTCLFLSLVVFASAQEYQGLLWKITGNGLQSPSYLYGTMHVSNRVAFHLSDSFFDAIEGVDVVSLEINPETWMQKMATDPYVAKRMGNVFNAPNSYQNESLYPSIFKLESPENSFLGKALASELGILNSLLYRTNNYQQDFQEDTYLDLFIYQVGKKNGKEITGLETLGYTTRLNEYLMKPINDKELRKQQEEEGRRRRFLLSKILNDRGYGEVMEDAYRAGDLDLLDSMSRLAGSTELYHDLIIKKRNVGMAEAMDSIMQEKSLFAGVGAAHLANTYGVIALLRDKGYTVEAVQQNKADKGVTRKEAIENKFITHPQKLFWSYDSVFSFKIPGEFYEFPESGGMQLGVYADMANGARYQLTRISTFGQLLKLSPQDYIDKIDSLLFENIPGKIEEEEHTTISGYPAIRIKNKTKSGDNESYTIVVTPLEVLVFKVAGKKEFVNREEVKAFHESITLKQPNGEWQNYAPANGAYTVSMPGMHVYESENTAIPAAYDRKTVQAYNPEKGYFLVLNRNYPDLSFMEEDSFELSQMTRFFFKNLDFDLKEWSHGEHQGYASYKAYAVNKAGEELRTLALMAGNQYYLLAAKTDKEEDANRFQESFIIQPFAYQTPFTLQHDSARLFSVTSPVEPPIEQASYSYYYNSGSDEDDSYLEDQKTAVYTYPSTAETIIVNYKRFHRYATVPSIDSLWSLNRINITEDGDQFIRAEKQWEENGLYYYQIEVGDTNSGRNYLAKLILKDGVQYSLFSETDYRKPHSKFISTFYNTFSPWDTTIGHSILKSKTALFLDHLLGPDSLFSDAAKKSFDEIVFHNEDVPQIINAFEACSTAKDGDYIRTNLVEKLGELKHPNLVPFLTEVYKNSGLNSDLQLAVLEALAKQKTKTASKLFVKLIMEDTPIPNRESDTYPAFRPFYDSLQLVENLYPKVFMLSVLPEYKSAVYALASRAADSSLLKKRLYRKQYKRLVWEAGNELKRQRSREIIKGGSFVEMASRNSLYSYNRDLWYYMNMLMPFHKKRKVAKFYTEVEQLQTPGIAVDLAVLKLVNKIEVDLAGLLEDPNNAIVLYNHIKDWEQEEKFPSGVATNTMVASSYAQKASININRDSITFLGKYEAQTPDDSGYVYFFKTKGKYDDEWEYGYIGLFDTTQTLFGQHKLVYNTDMRYNKYENEDLQLRMQTRKIEMAHRKRYDVTDEEAFKSLKRKQSYY